MTSGFVIGDRQVGDGAPCLVVGEVALAHDGSLGLAHAFIDVISYAGADAVKFQTHIAEAESTSEEPFRVAFSRQDTSRYAYWQRTGFDEGEWLGLAEHARDLGLLFLSTPFSLDAIELLERVGVPAWKVGSGEVSNTQLLERMAASGLPVLISSGMSSLDDLDAAVALLDGRVPLAVLQCTSAYPSPPERIGLNLLTDLRERYRCPVGLSDHSGTIFPALAAVTLGASIVEVHVTMSRAMFGPDVPASLTPDELRTLVTGMRFIETALAHPVDKNVLAHELEPLRAVFGRSIAPRVDLPAGTVLEEKHLALKKPGTGMPAERIPSLLGRRLTRDVPADSLLSEEDIG